MSIILIFFADVLLMLYIDLEYLIIKNIKYHIHNNEIFIYLNDLYNHFHPKYIKMLKQEVFISQYEFLNFLKSYYPCVLMDYFKKNISCFLNIKGIDSDICNDAINNNLYTTLSNIRQEASQDNNIRIELEYKLLCIEFKKYNNRWIS